MICATSPDRWLLPRPANLCEPKRCRRSRDRTHHQQAGAGRWCRAHHFHSSPDHGHPVRADDRHAAGSPRPDDRVHGPADHCRRPRRAPAPVLGRDGLPARIDSLHPVVRQDLRPLRSQAGIPFCHRRVPHRIGAGRIVDADVGAHRGPRDTGARRRWPDGVGLRDHRRCHSTSRTRPLPGLLRCGVRGLLGRGPAARWVLRRAPVLALDLLHQHPSGHHRPGRHRPSTARAAARPPRAQHRLPRRGPAGHRRKHPVARYGQRRRSRLDLSGDHRAAGQWSRSLGDLRLVGVPRRRADPAAALVPQPDLLGIQRNRVLHRLRHVRGDRVPAAVPADRPRRLADAVRTGAAAADGRPVHGLRHLRAADHHDRPLQALPHRRNRHHRRGAGASFDPGLGYPVLADGPVHADPRRGDRPGHAGHRPCHAELRRPAGHGVVSVYLPLTNSCYNGGFFQIYGSVQGAALTANRPLMGANDLSDVADAGSSRFNLSNPTLSAVAAVAVANVTISSPGATLDSYTLLTADEILLTAQTTGSQNGVWTWNGSTSALTRPNEFPSAGVVKRGRTVTVIKGTVYANTQWILDSTAAGITIDTTSQTWVTPAASVSPATTVTGPDASGASAVVGTGTTYARNDHDHGLPTIPAAVSPSTTVTGPDAYGASAVVGTGTNYAR